jgi:hypothetical protein
VCSELRALNVRYLRNWPVGLGPVRGEIYLLTYLASPHRNLRAVILVQVTYLLTYSVHGPQLNHEATIEPPPLNGHR